ncbi:condensation domain-containing protein [Saccharopolyspora pogona]|uniref:condensation domain-containing protein n=1 Tax=Saccharopolyspora pogona TaxID=333966 RepID=UPI0016882C51|nr:condensation domain-containing protein [Saccharopolyspora pogona]
MPAVSSSPIAALSRQLAPLGGVASQARGELLGVLESVPDPRKKRGVRHRFAAILFVSVCAVVSGARSFAAIAEWAADAVDDTLSEMGIGAPNASTIRRALSAFTGDGSAAQELVWLAQRLAPTSPLYNAAEYVEINGPLDVTSFEMAVRATVAEADALNARFVEDHGRAVQQHLRTTVDWPFPVIDLSGHADPSACAHRWMRADLAEIVDLSRGPVFGHALFKLGPTHYRWYHRCHHIALDGYGFSLVAQRVAQSYTTSINHRRWFGELREVVEADHAYQMSEQRELDRQFWMTHLADLPPTHSLSNRSQGPVKRILRQNKRLPTDVAAGLRKVAQRAEVSWAALVLAVVARHLHRRTTANEVVLGAPLMGRLGSPAARTPAMIANIVPLRVTVRPDDDLLDTTRSVARELRTVHPHTRYRSEHLRRDLRLLGGTRRLYGPVVNVLPFDYDLRFGDYRGVAKNISTGAQAIDDIAIHFHVRSNCAPELDLDANSHCYDDTELAAHLDMLTTDLVDAAQLPLALHGGS